MSLLSKYYVKQNIQNRLVENADINVDINTDVLDDEVLNIWNDVSYIRDNLMIVEENVSAPVVGFF